MFNFHKCRSDHILAKQSVEQNPYYFRGIVGFFVPPGTFAFIARLFANHSAAYPDGYLSQDTLKSFYAISGPDENQVYSPGNERIPENWYKRAANDLYTVPLFVADVLNLLKQHPELDAFGGNTGTVNSFAGLNITDLTVSYLLLSLFYTASSKKTLTNPAGPGRCLQYGNAPPRQQPWMLHFSIHRGSNTRSGSPRGCHRRRAGRGEQDEFRGSSGNERAWVSAAKPIRI